MKIMGLVRGYFDREQDETTMVSRNYRPRKNEAPTALPFPRSPERSRRNRRPHVEEVSKTPTANAIVRLYPAQRVVAERGAE